MKRRDLIASSVAMMAATGLRVPLGSLRPRRRARSAPSPQQLAWQDAAMGMFVHFGINTVTGREWGDGREDPALFNPARLDARQWIRAAQSAGCRYVVLTAKHHDGFCLWPSRVTDHSVKSSPWKGGQGDVVRDVADAARAAGIGLGLYLSPWDRNAASYGSGTAYDDIYIAQLTELLTGYGPLTEVWFDGANGEGPNGRKQTYDWPRIHATVRRHQPNALMFSDAGPDIRWIGNERGTAGDANWCTVDPSIVTEPGLDGPEIIRSLQHGDAPPRGTVWRPGEADVSIRPGWFHHVAEDARVKSPDALMEIWFNSVGRNANLLLNVPPAHDGLITEADLKALTGFGAAQRAFADRVIPAPMRRTAAAQIEVEFGAPARISAVLLEEDIAAGQRVSGYQVAVEGSRGAVTVARGTTIGRRKVDRFEPVETLRVRVLVEDAADLRAVRAVTMFRV